MVGGCCYSHREHLSVLWRTRVNFCENWRGIDQSCEYLLCAWTSFYTRQTRTAYVLICIWVFSSAYTYRYIYIYAKFIFLHLFIKSESLAWSLDSRIHYIDDSFRSKEPVCCSFAALRKSCRELTFCKGRTSLYEESSSHMPPPCLQTSQFRWTSLHRCTFDETFGEEVKHYIFYGTALSAGSWFLGLFLGSLLDNEIGTSLILGIWNSYSYPWSCNKYHLRQMTA